MRKFVAAIAVLLAGASMMIAAGPTLLDAAESGDRATALRLLNAKGTNVNATGADGTTAIMYAAANDDVELVRALIKAGANRETEEPVRYFGPHGSRDHRFRTHR
jgi:ankyrin repeat protein